VGALPGTGKADAAVDHGVAAWADIAAVVTSGFFRGDFGRRAASIDSILAAADHPNFIAAGSVARMLVVGLDVDRRTDGRDRSLPGNRPRWQLPSWPYSPRDSLAQPGQFYLQPFPLTLT